MRSVNAGAAPRYGTWVISMPVICIHNNSARCGPPPMPGELHLPPEARIRYRVGINLGDIVIDDDDILGDGVNIASRIEGLADPGGICISASAYEQIRGKTEY